MVPPQPPEPNRQENVVAKTLVRYILTTAEMEVFLKRKFSTYENYDFDVRVCP
jgi:hypothetical protein